MTILGDHQSQRPGIRFLRLPEVMSMTGLSKSEIYRRMNSGENPVPKPHRYRDGGPRASVFWPSNEIEDWQMKELGA